jgi:hypothetical protein
MDTAFIREYYRTKAIATRNNSTLKITKNKEYKIYIYKDANLVGTINDVGDEIVLRNNCFKY